jgi:hypothetical protein
LNKDSNHPFFRPLWRRVAVVAFCVAWAIFEFATGTPFWGVIALGFAGYGVWQFFVIYDATEPAKPADTEAEKE